MRKGWGLRIAAAAMSALLALSGAALAQQMEMMRAVPRSPMPEDAVPPEQRIAFLQTYVQSDAARGLRDHAFLRLITRLRASRDRAALEEWTARRLAFTLEQEAIILRDHAANPPPPVRLCAPPADARPLNFPETRRYCAPDFDSDGRLADDFEILARAADSRDEHERRIALLESKLLLRWWRVPDQVRWGSLAREAADVGQFEAALRYCTVTLNEPIYLAYPHMRNGDEEDANRCAADVKFLMGDWEGWLALYESRLSGASAENIENRVRLCVAATRAGRGNATRACDWAAESVRIRHENETVGRQTSPARLARLEREKARFDAAIAACRRSSGEECRLESRPATPRI